MQFKRALLLTFGYAILDSASSMLYYKLRYGEEELEVPSFSDIVELNLWLRGSDVELSDITFREATESEMLKFSFEDLAKLTKGQKDELLGLQWIAKENVVIKAMRKTLLGDSGNESEMHPPEAEDALDGFDPFGFFPGSSEDENFDNDAAVGSGDAEDNDDGGGNYGGGEGSSDDDESVLSRFKNLGIRKTPSLTIPSKSPTRECRNYENNCSPPDRKSRRTDGSFEAKVVSGHNNLLRASSGNYKVAADSSGLWKYKSTNHFPTHTASRTPVSFSSRPLAPLPPKDDGKADGKHPPQRGLFSSSSSLA